MEKAQVTPLFERMWNAAKETLDNLMQPSEKKKLILKFKNKYQSLEEKKTEKLIEIQTLSGDLKQYDLDKYLKAKQEIKDYEYTQGELKAHYLEMFGKNMNVED